MSRRLEDDERTRLKEILKQIDVKKGGVIVRTAAEGASAEDVERDLVFLQKLWKTIEAQAKKAKAPKLIYQEAELPLRVTRDLFTENFARAYVDDDKAFRRITGYLKKTSPHMVERVHRYKEKEPLLERYGVDAEIRSTLSRRVDLPSGGYLVFDYAEAFTVIDVNTGRFVGSRSKTSASRLEDTITKNNLEAVKEVVRQLRLRDIGGIIVIDFIDMANPKNRQAVEDALRTELERDRTKTYVVEISPLGLVEMTRQNVTEGPREILTRKCPTCGGDGVVISEQSAAIDLERRLRTLARGSRVQAYRVEVNARVASLLIGSGASRLQEIEAASRRRFFLVPKEDVHLDHFLVLEQGKLETFAPDAPFAEGATLELQPVEVGLARSTGCGRQARRLRHRRRGCGAARRQEGEGAESSASCRDVAYATIVSAAKDGSAPITAEGEAEKPTRKPAAKKEAADVRGRCRDRRTRSGGPMRPSRTAAEAEPKKKTRRGSRGGRRRKKSPTIHVPEAEASANGEEPAPRHGAGAAEPRSERSPRAGSGARATAPSRPRRTATPEEAQDAPRLARRPEPAQEAGGRGSRRNERERLEFSGRGHLPAFRTSWLNTRSSASVASSTSSKKARTCSWTVWTAKKARRFSPTCCSSAATAGESSRRSPR